MHVGRSWTTLVISLRQPIRGMRVSPTRPHLGLIDLIRELRHDAIRTVKCPPWLGTVEHPDIRYVVYPVHLDGSRTGAKPRLRHDPGCGHFEWRDGTILGTPELATEEQMHTLRACKTYIAARADSPADARSSMKDGRIGEVCPIYNQAMSLTGVCDNCSW